MSEENAAVYGIFYDKELAANSYERLKAESFDEAEVTMKDPSLLGMKDLAHDADAIEGSSTSIVVTCVAIGGIVGFISGFAFSTVTGFEAAVPAAPMVGALLGFGVGGLMGGIFDALDVRSVDEPGAKRYEGEVPEGGILVAVHCHNSDDVTRAENLLLVTGAKEVFHTPEVVPA